MTTLKVAFNKARSFLKTISISTFKIIFLEVLTFKMLNAFKRDTQANNQLWWYGIYFLHR